jgi:hypothetical protein
MKSDDIMNSKQERAFNNFIKRLTDIIVKVHLELKESGKPTKSNTDKQKSKRI